MLVNVGATLIPMATPLTCLYMLPSNSNILWANTIYSIVLMCSGGMQHTSLCCTFNLTALSIPSCIGMTSYKDLTSSVTDMMSVG